MLARDHFACVQCGTRTELEVDHIVSVAKGGSWELDNLQTLCRPHHRRKTYHEDR
ncbi:HNH endonuclease [Streptomyces sp. H39-S7]|uniref:HNH endonuclease n=1 Tax=Streptomyces sp. H39-S7 TaxID=3004357 RepID=UPI003FA71E5D